MQRQDPAVQVVKKTGEETMEVVKRPRLQNNAVETLKFNPDDEAQKLHS